VWTRDEALVDLRRLREAGSQRFLAARWGVDPTTVSRWLGEFERNGAIERSRDGKRKALVVVQGGRVVA
jgi:DNA-binding MarR family transcriptional regulator